ncbi:hypothetical protein Sjap_020402 [Stephania japonica]|uniref:Uncharacterized protein n=1 Tax=Stephania japonica TaxID=461633 RepID=A0AAP0F800_9MAGN
MRSRSGFTHFAEGSKSASSSTSQICSSFSGGIVSEVLRVLLEKYGKGWDDRGVEKILGKTPFEAAAAIVGDYELPFTRDGWCNIKALPGANRLIKHLKAHGVPMALASNSR